jgi:hypothetical protein
MEAADYIFPKEEHAFIHEVRIRRQLILRSIEDDEVYIHGNSHEKKYVFSLTLEESFFEKKPKSILDCPSTSMIL